jgi:uncharacterized membrane protein
MAVTYNEQQKSILSLYALISAGAILTALPFSLLPYAGMACILVGFIAGYIYRMRNREYYFMVRHTTYIIRTVWWSFLILLAGVFFFACILVYNGDLSPIYQLMQQADRGVPPNQSDVRIMQDTFVRLNKDLIVISAIFCLMPYPAFVLYRCFKGVREIKKGG